MLLLEPLFFTINFLTIIFGGSKTPLFSFINPFVVETVTVFERYPFAWV